MKQLKKIYTNDIFLNSCLIIMTLLSYKTSKAQENIWIDKSENENYTPRHECSFVQAGDKFIMFGGREKAQQLDVYDFKNNSWSIGGKAPKQFNHFQATFYEGFIWVLGSFRTNKFPREIPADYVWLYYPPTKTWIQGPEIPKDRRRGGAGLVVYNDKFYLVGGNTIGHDGGFVNWFDEYDPVKNTWTRLENASQARDHFSAAVIDEMLYAVGGRRSGGKGGVFAPLIDVVDTYNFKTKTWSTLRKPLPTPRAAPGITVFKNKLYVMGGEGATEGPAFKTLEVYNPKTQTWETKKEMLYARHGTQAISSGKGIYIAGGSPKQGGGRQLNMEVYNKDTPKGKPLVGSLLDVSDNVCFKTNSIKTISITNKKGNTGSFINSITIEGNHKDKFKLNGISLNKTLLINQGKKKLEIEHIGTSENDEAVITIIYNGNLNKTIRLISD